MTKKKTKPESYRKSYKFRACPLGSTAKKATRQMRTCAGIWNNAVKERWDSYEKSQADDSVKPVTSAYSQYHLIRKREHPEYANMDAQCMQDVLTKVDGSFKSFFQLRKKGHADAMPPRFKEKYQYRNLVFRQSGWRLDGNYLHISRVGIFKLKLHREIIGRIKTVTLSRRMGKWYVCFSCDQVPRLAAPKSRKQVKLYFANGCFLYDSQGQTVHHPEFYFSAIPKLRQLSRSLSRKKNGSCNRYRAKKQLNRFHDHIANKRRAFLWELANEYVKTYDILTIPKMPLKMAIQHATTSRIAMRMCDSAYAMFCDMLEHKAVEKQKKIVKYDVEKLFDIKKKNGMCDAVSQKVIVQQ